MGFVRTWDEIPGTKPLRRQCKGFFVSTRARSQALDTEVRATQQYVQMKEVR